MAQATSRWSSGCSSAAYQRLQQGAQRVSRGVWAPLHAALLAVLLLAGVLPLYFSTVRRTREQADDLQALCGLYPNTMWVPMSNQTAPPPPPPGAAGGSSPGAGAGAGASTAGGGSGTGSSPAGGPAGPTGGGAGGAPAATAGGASSSSPGASPTPLPSSGALTTPPPSQTSPIVSGGSIPQAPVPPGFGNSTADFPVPPEDTGGTEVGPADPGDANGASVGRRRGRRLSATPSGSAGSSSTSPSTSRAPSGAPDTSSDNWEDYANQVAVPVAAPPAPPGARSVNGVEECYSQFETYFDYEGSDYSKYYDLNAPWGRAAYIKFTVTIQDVDPKRLAASARVSMTTSGTLRYRGNRLYVPDGYVLSVSFNGAPADEYSKGDVFGSGTLKLLDNIPVATQNDLSNYPFDRYKFKIYVVAFFINTKNDNATVYAPFLAGMRTRSPAFSFSVPLGSSDSYVTDSESAFTYRIMVQRNQTTKGFSIFIFIIMWALTIFCVVHAVWVMAFRPDPAVPYDVPAYSATLLFALPAVRAVQPGVPDVGAVIDIVGFFWNMALLALTCCWLLAAIYARYRARQDLQQQQQQAQEPQYNEVYVKEGVVVGVWDEGMGKGGGEAGAGAREGRGEGASGAGAEAGRVAQLPV